MNLCVPELSVVGEYVVIVAYFVLFSFSAWVIWDISRSK